MTDPLNPDYCVKCQKCGKDFEMVWGENNDVCNNCVLAPTREYAKEYIQSEEFQNILKTPLTDDKFFEIVNTSQEFSMQTLQRRAEALEAIAEFYSNPDNWRRFPVDTGTDANGSPVQQYFWIGDGGEFARTNLQPSE